MQIIDAPQLGAHEHLIQTLSAMMVRLNALQSLTNTESLDAAPDLQAIRSGLAALERMTRQVLYELRSAYDDAPLPELTGVALPEALSRAVEDTAETLGLSSRVTVSGEERTLSGEIERLLYRIARESLYAIQQHAGVHRLRFTLNYGRDDVQMSIEDDGTSAEQNEPVTNDNNDPPALLFLETTSPSNILLTGLRHHIEHLGGSLETATSIEHGTRVQARVPYLSSTSSEAATEPVRATLTPPVASLEQTHVRVLVVDSQAVTRAGLRHLLESYPDLEVAGEASDGVQAVSETIELGPQVVLMDTQLPNGQSLEALRQIKQLNLNTQVLLLSSQDREEYLYETLRAGAGGFVLKDIAPDELAQAIRTVARGEVLIQPQLAGRLLSRFGRQSRGEQKENKSIKKSYSRGKNSRKTNKKWEEV
jgi:DNA-binding NarL/FixJ family response regulator